MGCIKPPDGVTDPPPRRAGRLAFALGRAATVGAMDGQPATDEDRGQPVRAVLADADQAELRATSEIGRSKNEADVDRAIQRAREAVQAALRNTRSQSVRRSLETKLRIIERQAADRKQTIKLEYWDARSHSQLDRLNDADLRAISLITHTGLPTVT